MCVCVCLSTGASEKTDFAHFAVLKLRICCTLEGYFERKEVLSVVVFKQADLERAKKKKKKMRARAGAECPSLCSWLSPKWLALGGQSRGFVGVCSVRACVRVRDALLSVKGGREREKKKRFSSFLPSCHKVFL